MVKTIPAIPGSVKTAPKPERIPKINRIFNIRAILEYIPTLP